MTMLEKTVSQRARVAFNAMGASLSALQKHIDQLERSMRAQTKLEERIAQLEAVIARHDARIAERDAAVKKANDDLHLSRLENVRCRREITHLKKRIGNLLAAMEGENA